MRQKIIGGLILSMLACISIFAFARSKTHLTELNTKFPYGLLGDDYGVLTMNDLAINACGVTPKPFKADNSDYNPYEYWQCFESKNISFNCDSNGVPDKHEGPLALVVTKVSLKKVEHKYFERRLWPIKDCRSFIKDAAALLKGIQYACISGSFIESGTDHSGHIFNSWIFERIKTQKGCEGHDCELTLKLQQINCPKI